MTSASGVKASYGSSTKPIISWFGMSMKLLLVKVTTLIKFIQHAVGYLA